MTRMRYLLLPLICLSLGLGGSVFAAEYDFLTGPAFYKDHSTDYGLHGGAGVYKQVAQYTDIGLLLSVGVYEGRKDLDLISMFELRQGLGSRVDILLGAGGKSLRGGRYGVSKWEGYLHLSGGLAYNFDHSSVEVRYSPANKGPELYRYQGFMISWRLPFGSFKRSGQNDPEDSEFHGI